MAGGEARKQSGAHLGADVLAPDIKSEQGGDREHLSGAAGGDGHEEKAHNEEGPGLAHQRPATGWHHQVAVHFVQRNLHAQPQSFDQPSVLAKTDARGCLGFRV